MRVTLVMLSVLTCFVPLRAQTDAGHPPAAVAASQDGYVYQPDGRRDPFVSVLGGGTDTHAAVKRGEGLESLTLAEISVRGIMQSRDTLVAMVQGPDNRTYLIHQGDKLADAVVKSVTAQGLVLMQDVSDPLSVQKQREVRKLLRSLEDAKE